MLAHGAQTIWKTKSLQTCAQAVQMVAQQQGLITPQQQGFKQTIAIGKAAIRKWHCVGRDTINPGIGLAYHPLGVSRED